MSMSMDAHCDKSDRLERRTPYSDDERGVTTIEYTMVLGFMSSISIYVTIWLISVLKNTVAVLAIKMAIFLTGFPSS